MIEARMLTPAYEAMPEQKRRVVYRLKLGIGLRRQTRCRELYRC